MATDPDRSNVGIVAFADWVGASEGSSVATLPPDRPDTATDETNGQRVKTLNEVSPCIQKRMRLWMRQWQRERPFHV